jgi:hypothetical protein
LFILFINFCLQNEGLTMPVGVAIDWIARNVYITDSSDGKTPTSKRPAAGAGAAAASLSKSTTMKTGSSSNPGTIKAAVGSSAPRIIVCSADGSMCHALITSGLDKPRAIVLHPQEG